MDSHHHGPHTRAERNDAKPATAGLWPLWLILGLLVAVGISMATTGHGSAVTGLLGMLLWVVAYILIVVSVIMIPICLFDKDSRGKRDMKGVVIYLIALLISLIIAVFTGPFQLL